jgi:hypothetical protein
MKTNQLTQIRIQHTGIGLPYTIVGMSNCTRVSISPDKFARVGDSISTAELDYIAYSSRVAVEIFSNLK